MGFLEIFISNVTRRGEAVACLNKLYSLLGLNSTDWIGFVGVFQILLAYILNVRNIVKKGDLSFILLNLSGASLACLASYMMSYWPFILLEGIWAFVSLLALFSYFKKV